MLEFMYCGEFVKNSIGSINARSRRDQLFVILDFAIYFCYNSMNNNNIFAEVGTAWKALNYGTLDKGR